MCVTEWLKIQLRMSTKTLTYDIHSFCWLVVLRININLAIFQSYFDLEAGDNQSLKIQVARLGIKPRSSCSASQEHNHSATAAPHKVFTAKLTLVLLRLLQPIPLSKTQYYWFVCRDLNVKQALMILNLINCQLKCQILRTVV